MKLRYKPIEKNLHRSIYVKRIHQPYVLGDWHFHKEYELIYFLEGNGIRIVGDHISHFQKGELVLVGSWLPHLWRNNVGDSKEANTDFIVVKFNKEFQGLNLFALPELSTIRNLLNISSRGILFSGIKPAKIQHLLIRLSESQKADILIHFLQILQLLAHEKDYQLLASPDFALPMQLPREDRLQKIINYISLHYASMITLADIAEIAHMTPPSFCRFFKARTNKTFNYFLNEFRINKACQLLINGEKPIKQICFEVGFNSLTNFNRSFKSFKGQTPNEYRASYHTIRQ